MKERPILFSSPMIRALLAGTKTQTRRAVRNDTPISEADYKAFKNQRGIPRNAQNVRMLGYLKCDSPPGSATVSCRVHSPYGLAGDRLWVRETWQPIWATESRPSSNSSDGWAIGYPATDGVQEYHDDDHGLTTRCKPSIFMPRWASRITLEVTSVRVERLHAITDADTWAEGIEQIDGEIDNSAICRAAHFMACCAEED